MQRDYPAYQRLEGLRVQDKTYLEALDITSHNLNFAADDIARAAGDIAKTKNCLSLPIPQIIGV